MSFIINFNRRAAIKELTAMLAIRRPARSRSEESFVAKYIDTLPGVTADDYGNRLIRVGNAKTRPPVLWSSHTDTVHTKDGAQQVVRDGDLVRLYNKEKDSSCLGGDDSAGVWIMRQMILRGIPGNYLFHRDEEVGGLGSEHIATNLPQLLDGVQCAIAIDRKGYDSVITHQGARCASDSFAQSLARQLGGAYKPDDTGVFTDTANYTRIIPECSNLSCGYHNAHSKDETQDVRFAYDLLERLCAIDFSKIIIERDPSAIDVDSYYWRDSWFDMDYMQPQTKTPKARRYHQDNMQALVDLIKYEDANAIADYLDAVGIDARDLEDAIKYSF